MFLISTLFKILLWVVIVGAITSIFTFLHDVRRWHDKEEKVIIIPSNDVPADDLAADAKGVNDNASND